ncbi:MAG TPA: cupredoxin domain-containing protein [Candidatus Baltobacteraceae bacterium]|nr:cupredoxin domain-containing protein [Candidatus Baltobacteraceae bacterium]
MVSMAKAIGGIVVIVIIIAAIALAYGKIGSSGGSPYGSGSTTVAAAPASGGASLSLQLSNAQGQFVITPNVITVKAGESVTINVTNDGTMVHSFVIPDISVSAPDLSPGQSAVLTFTAPAAGNYTYYCPVDSHKTLGMVGTLVVSGS